MTGTPGSAGAAGAAGTPGSAGAARTAFDAFAADYDAWSERPLGRVLRAAAWRWLDRSFETGDRVLELGCGSGQDAIHLAGRGVTVVATDRSSAMLETAQRNVAAAGAADLVTLGRLDMATVGSDGWRELLPANDEAFDGAYSDFGALNCIPDRKRFGAGLASTVRPGGRLVLVAMPPACLWEIAWHLAHGEPDIAARRFRSGAPANVGGARVRVWYPSPGRLRTDLAPWFRPVALGPLGVVLPPSGLAGIVDSRPRLLGLLDAIERRVRDRAPFAWLADHYAFVFERQG